MKIETQNNYEAAREATNAIKDIQFVEETDKVLFASKVKELSLQKYRVQSMTPIYTPSFEDREGSLQEGQLQYIAIMVKY